MAIAAWGDRPGARLQETAAPGLIEAGSEAIASGVIRHVSSGAQAILVIAIPVVRVAFVRGFQRMADAMDKMDAGGGDDQVIP